MSLGRGPLISDLWNAADHLRANSKLTSSDYCMPVLGVIFLRHAANRFEAAQRQIDADQASGKMPKRKVRPEDYIARRALFLPKNARYEWMIQQAAVSGVDFPKLVTDAMTAIEDTFPPLKGVLPKDYGIFEPKVLEDLMRLFNSEQVRQATGDVFGRIYEYFLAEFSVQKAHDNGEFFTPPSLVQTIVNVIEPDHGLVFDPASGSGGMFVQSSHFIEHKGGDTAKKVVFYGQEKNRDTIHIAKMNLAVHGLEGKIAEAILGLVKQVDLLYKLAARVADLGNEMSLAPGNGGEGKGEGLTYDRRSTGKLIKQLDEQRKTAVEQMKQAAYVHRQVLWLQDRFPKAELEDVPGLVKLVDRKEIEAADWSLTPGRYVGVAPPEEDEDFDFEQTLRDIHTELADLNKETAELAAKIQENFEELGA
ncbi:MAG: N-6 DNA methylase [Nitrospira sp.]|nr:N-6 DNA methylase [Nitrospira sp.]